MIVKISIPMKIFTNVLQPEVGKCFVWPKSACCPSVILQWLSAAYIFFLLVLSVRSVFGSGVK